MLYTPSALSRSLHLILGYAGALFLAILARGLRMKKWRNVLLAEQEALSKDEVRHGEMMRRRWFKVRFGVAMAVLGILLGSSGAIMLKADVVDGRRIVVIDGDTIDSQGERIRILNIDAPESFRLRCEAELKLALRTKERLAELLRSGPVEINREGQDRYRRTLARLSVREGEVGQTLFSGAARPSLEGWP
jgi:micrococcal nuclease